MSWAPYLSNSIPQTETISSDDCRYMWETGQTRLRGVGGKAKVFNVLRDGVSNQQYNTHGTTGYYSDFYCSGEKMVVGDKTYGQIIRSVEEQLTMETLRARISETGDIVILGEDRLLKCKAADRSCVDSGKTYLWNEPTGDDACRFFKVNEAVGVQYETTRADGKAATLFRAQDDSMVRVIVEGPITACEGRLLMTNYHNIFVTEDANPLFQREMAADQLKSYTYTVGRFRVCLCFSLGSNRAPFIAVSPFSAVSLRLVLTSASLSSQNMKADYLYHRQRSDVQTQLGRYYQEACKSSTSTENAELFALLAAKREAVLSGGALHIGNSYRFKS